MQIIKYGPAKFGMGTESTLNLQPLDFSPSIINRFYNLLGDLEKRPGLQQLGAQITSAYGVTASAQITNLHEYINISGNSTLFASGIADDGINRYGLIWRYNEVTAYWQNIFDVPIHAKTPTSKVYSVQMNDKLIFCNGIDRNFFIDKPSDPVTAGTIFPANTTYHYTQQLSSTITKGTTGSGTTSNLLFDADISNWKTETNVALNDLVTYAVTAFGTQVINLSGIVTSVGTSSLEVTQIGSAGSTGIGNIGPVMPAPAMSSGKGYKIIDLVELNIFQTPAPGGNVFDNVAVGGAATNSSVIGVTALDFSTTLIRPGDYVYNTTRAAVTIVTTVSSNINVITVSAQTAGDSFVFLKDSMPIATYPHVHYSQLYLIDARDTTKIRVSGPNDPEDFTTFSKTLASSSLDYSSRQPQGDILLTMSTFQSYFVVGGQQNLYVIDGTTPIAEVTADVIDLKPVGLFQQGVVSHLGFGNIGGEMLYLARDGLRSFLAAYSSNNTITSNKAEQIKSQLIDAIQLLLNTPEALQLVHYPRRNWILIKVGDIMFNYNYTPIYQPGQSIYLAAANFPTITQFKGLIANQDAFFVKRDGTMIMGDETGTIYNFDVSGVFTDNGANIPTTYISPWHSLQEAQTDIKMLNIDGRYIKPVFETSAQIKYNISVVGDYHDLADDSIVVTSNSSGITNPKMPLRWRGQEGQITITTDTSVGTDIIHNYTIYGNVFGRR